MSFLKDQIKSKSNPVAAEYQRILKQEMVTEASSWDWKAKGHKIYPSGLKFSMCPYDYVRNLPNYSGISNEGQRRRVEKGKVIHLLLQSKLVKSPKIVFKQMCFTNIETVQELHKKLQEDLCEIPIRDIASGISGKADLPPWRLDKDRLACIDIKSTTKPRAQFEKLNISMQYRTQLCVYSHLWNKQGSWPEKVNTIGCMYYNDAEDCASLECFREVYEPFTPELDKAAGELLFHLAWERLMFLFGMDSQCTYKACHTHFGGAEE